VANLWVGANAWGDYDGDGDLDFVISGVSAGGTLITALYANNGGTFAEVTTAHFTGVGVGSVEWGDYDNDGDLDLLICGVTANSIDDKKPITRLYTNIGGGHFEELTSARLPAIFHGEAKWGDYNNDGRLDIVLAGNGKTGIFKNMGNGTFSELPNLDLQFLFELGRASWSDYDQDGDLDLFVSGWTGSVVNDGSAAKLYRNDGHDTFVDATPSLIRGQHGGDAVWADADADGDLDLVVAGAYRLNGNDQYYSVLYLNDHGTFTASSRTAFWVIDDGSLAWGDADNDGLSDLLLISGAYTTMRSIVYHNNGNGTFREVSEAQSHLRGFRDSDAAWGDYDNDGDLDLLLIGLYNGVTKVYRNETVAVNHRPASPTAANATVVSSTSATLSWSASTDDLTPAPGLNYNFYVGSKENKQSIVCAMANPLTGARAIAAMGNAGSAQSYMLQGLPGGRHFWGVQAIDAAFLGSAFTAEQSFIIPLTSSIAAAQATACAGEPVRITYAGNAGATAQFTWDFGDGTVVAGTGRGPYLVQWGASGAKTVRLAVTDDDLAAPPAIAHLLINSRPTATLSGDTLLCDGPANFQVGLTGAAPWLLSYSTGDGIHQVRVATSPFTFTTDSTGTSKILALTDASGCSAQATGDTIQVKRCLKTLTPYPNPTAGTLHLGLSARSGPGGVVSVWNLQGQLVWNKELTGPELGQPLTLPLPTGLYLLQLLTANQTTRTKVMINR